MPYLSEQFRVCKPGGVVSVISSRTEAAINSEDWQPTSGEEQKLWERLVKTVQGWKNKYEVCLHPLSVPEIPRYIEKAGFINVSVDFIAVTSASDTLKNRFDKRIQMLNESKKVWDISVSMLMVARGYKPDI